MNRNHISCVSAIFAVWVWTAAGQDPELLVRFNFDEPSGPPRSSATREFALCTMDFLGAAGVYQGGPGTGVNAAAARDRALDFSSATAQGTNGPVAATTNANLGFGDVTPFTATIWLRQQTRQPSNIGPRVFLLGAADTTSDTGVTNSIGLKFQTASQLHFQLNNVTAEANFVWNLPTNTWIFLALVYDGTHLFTYHGSRENPAILIGAKLCPGEKVSFGEKGALFIGNRPDRARAFDGWIDDFRFYRGAAGPNLVEQIRREAAGDVSDREGGNPARPVGDASRAQWVVVAAPAFVEPLKPLIEHRRAAGMKVQVIKTTDALSPQAINQADGTALKAKLQEIFHGQQGPKYLLLAGVSAGSRDCKPEEVVVPGLPGVTARMAGQLTDFFYGLPDRDGTPTVAVGRFPARTVQEMRAMVQKTLDLERMRNGAAWQERLLVIQGNPGGGPMAEAFVEQVTSPRLARVHPSWNIRAISQNGGSAYFLPTSWLHDRTAEYLREGALFSVYLGHSAPAGLWSLTTNFLSSTDCSRIDLGDRKGVFFSCGCFGCQPDRPQEESYGMAAMRNPAGPSAVIGAVGESWAAPGLLAADGLLRCCLHEPFPRRLADYWLAVQTNLAAGEIDALTFGLFDQFDGSASKVPLSMQRREHLEMWLLLGDPALALPLPSDPISLSPQGLVVPGRTLVISGSLPQQLSGAKVRVSLDRPLGLRPDNWEKLPASTADNRAERDRIAAANHQRANNSVLASAEVQAEGRRFNCSFDVPREYRGPMLVIRAQAEGAERSSRGAITLPVTAIQPGSPKTAAK